MYLSGLQQVYNGKRAKSLCRMVKMRKQVLIMGEIPKSPKKGIAILKESKTAVASLFFYSNHKSITLIELNSTR